MDESTQVLKQAYQEAYRNFVHAVASNNEVEALESLTTMTNIALYYQKYIGESVVVVSNTLCMWRLEVAVSKESRLTE